jgi:hypothetical protein
MSDILDLIDAGNHRAKKTWEPWEHWELCELGNPDGHAASLKT